MSNLKRYTGEEVISVIKWKVSHLIEVFKEEGIPVTDENIDAFVQSSAPSDLEFISIEDGWETLQFIVENMLHNNKFNAPNKELL